MPLDPALQPLIPVPALGEIADYPAFRLEGAAGERALIDSVAEPGPEVLERRIEILPVVGGSIELAIYRPDATPDLPVHLYIHGGGWIVGSALGPSTDIVARERAVGARCVVAAVNYRKAPEHRFPVPLLDCQAGLEWLLGHASALDIDPERTTVGGGSAGANLAAALCLKLRDERGPAIALQILEVPTLDLTLSLPSHADRELGSRYSLHADDFRRMVAAYLGAAGDASDPYASPLLATDVSGVAPALVMVAEYDMLRDDGIRYHEKLTGSGVPSQLYVGQGLVHGSHAFTSVSAPARAWRSELLRALAIANGAR